MQTTTETRAEQAHQERAEFIAEGEAGLAEVKATADHWQEQATR